MSAGLAWATFAYPFRPGWGRAWAVGVPLAFVCPVGVIPLLGYSIAATRSAIAGDEALPRWRLEARLLVDGALLLLLLVGVTAPFALVVAGASAPISRVLPVGSLFLARAYAALAVGFPLAIAWAFAALVIVPAGVARYAASGRARDLFDLGASLRTLRRRFVEWNLAGVPIVTAWAVVVLAVPAGAIGAPFAAFYAILVSAHASSTLAEKTPA
ncbi:MAG TPA: DUF4013 domain-containing protein [Candidatus Dormibacteraeota bacterium]